MPDELLRRRSIESLKKEAKRWLSLLHDNDEEARDRFLRVVPNIPNSITLRDVQHALAVEQGFPGWVALTDRITADSETSAATMQEFETMAAALFDAYYQGTDEAMRRHWHYTWHRRPWQGMRTYVQVDLGKPAGPSVDITMDDARFLVAREHGFESWNALAKDVATRPVQGVMLTKPVAAITRSSTHSEGWGTQSRYWNVVLSELKADESYGLDGHGQVTDAMLEEVSRIPHLTTLKLGGSQLVTDEGVKHLARLTQLTYLDLSGTAITDRGLSALSSLTALKRISLSWTRVSDAGIAVLSHAENIEHVNVSGTACGDGAIRAFVGKQKLRHYMSGEGVTDAGLPLLNEYPVFSEWQGGDMRDAVLGYDSEPNNLMLRGVFTDRGVASLRTLNGLFGLNLDDSNLRVTGHALAPLVNLPHLGWLAFDAKDDAMPYIAQMPVLRGLACQDTPATDRGWVALGKSKSIERIWGRRCYGLESDGFRALATMPSLLSLSVSCKNVSDEALAALPHFPRLQELMPMDVPDVGYRHIAGCPLLTALVLMYCRDTTDAATEHIAAMTTLVRYFASYTQITDRTPELLSQVTSLRNVTFDSCAGLTNAGIAALARLPHLSELRISGRGITESVKSAFPPTVKVQYGL